MYARTVSNPKRAHIFFLEIYPGCYIHSSEVFGTHSLPKEEKQYRAILLGGIFIYDSIPY